MKKKILLFIAMAVVSFDVFQSSITIRIAGEDHLGGGRTYLVTDENIIKQCRCWNNRLKPGVYSGVVVEGDDRDERCLHKVSQKIGE